MNVRDEDNAALVAARLRETYAAVTTRTVYRDRPASPVASLARGEGGEDDTRPRSRFLVFAAAFLAIVVAVVVAWFAVVDTGPQPAQPASGVPSVADFYRRLARAVERPGSVYRQAETLRLEQTFQGGRGSVLMGTFERITWIDSSTGGARMDQTASPQDQTRFAQLVSDDHGYNVVKVIEKGIATGQIDARDTGVVPSCYGTSPALAILLDCPSQQSGLRARQKVTLSSHGRVRTFVLETTTNPVSALRSTGTSPITTRLSVDAKTFLPIARATVQNSKVSVSGSTGTHTRDAKMSGRSTYHTEFVDSSSLAPNFFTVLSATSWAQGA